MIDKPEGPETPDQEAGQSPTSEKPSSRRDRLAEIENETWLKIGIQATPVTVVATLQEDETDPDYSRMKLCVEKLCGQVPEAESVCADSEIREDKVFAKKHILQLMVIFAMSKKLDLDKLKVARVIRDQKDNLLLLEVKSPTADGGYQLMNYTIKGRHAGNQGKTSSIDQTSFDSDDMPEGGDIIAEYKDGIWVFSA